MSHRMPQCAKHTNELLKELERDHEFELLREYLTQYNLFPRKRDPATAPIRYEELKELVKHWKLHSQRNFWRHHTKKEDLVKTLHKHIYTKILPNQQRQRKLMENSNGESVASPSPPKGSQIRTPSKTRLKLLHLDREEEDLDKPAPTYTGDLFNQRGKYDSGLIYLSRMGRETKRENKSGRDIARKDEMKVLDDVGDDEKDKVAGVDAGAVFDGKSVNRELELKRKCACSLYQLTNEAGKEASVVSEGCMPAIVRLSLYDDTETKRFCSATIVNLSCDASICPRMIDEGVLTALSELSKMQHEVIRRNSSTALCRISYDKQGQVRLVQEGGVTSMLSMLNSSDYRTQEACIKALINISSFSGSPITEAVIQGIISIAHFASNQTKTGEQFEFVADAIQNISLLSSSRVKGVDDGLLEAVSLLSQATDELQVQESLATAIFNFSGLHSNHNAMAEVRILECIKQLLTSPRERVKELCCLAIANLSCNAVALDHLVLNGMISQIIRVGKTANNCVQSSVAQCMSNMATNNDNRPLLAKEGAVSLLVQYLKDGSIAVKQFSVIALCNMMVHPSTRTDVVQYNIIPCLVSLAESQDVKIREICALAICNLSCDGSLLSLINDSEVIAALVSLCDLQPDFKLKMPVNKLSGLTISQEYCVGSIYNTSFDPTCRESLVNGSIIAMLCGLILVKKKSFSENVLQQCSAILCNISFTANCRKSIVIEGGIKLIERLVASTCKETLLCCSTTLCNLVIEAMHDSNIMPLLIKLSGTSHNDVTLSCAIAFAKLSTKEAMRDRLVACEEYAPTLTFMMRSGREEIQISAATALCNLACESASEMAVWKPKMVPNFIVNSLLRVNSTATKEVCAKALFNLLTHVKSRKSMVGEGVLYALVKLARLECLEIRLLCVIALYNMSCDESQIEGLMEMNVVRVIASLSEGECTTPTIRRLLAACLTNIASSKVGGEKLIQGGALTAVLLLSKHQEQFTLRHCGSILCSLSLNKNCCQDLSSDAMMDILLTMIGGMDSEQCVFALNCLCNLASNAALHAVLFGGSLPSQLLQIICRTDIEEDIRSSAFKTLYNLTYDSGNFSKLLEMDAINAILKTQEIETIEDDTLTTCANLVCKLCEEESHLKTLCSSATFTILSTCSSRLDHEIADTCLLAAARLSLHITNDSRIEMGVLLDILLASMQRAASIEESASSRNTILYRCSAILRNFSIFPFSREAMVFDARVIGILQKLSKALDNKTCRNCALTLYNMIVNGKRANNDTSTDIVAILIELSQKGYLDVRQICSVTLANVNSEARQSNSSTTSSEGLVSTLVSMLDMDHSKVKKINQLAFEISEPISSTTPHWQFVAGIVGRPANSEVYVNWNTNVVSFDESSYLPVEPHTYLTSLQSVSVEATANIEEEVVGTFCVMKVGTSKCILKHIDDPPSISRKSTRSILHSLSKSDDVKSRRSIRGSSTSDVHRH